jgi:N4-gp56 family major capsid protein
MPEFVSYGDISQRSAVTAYGKLLKRTTPGIVLERTGQVKTMEPNTGKTVVFRRYLKLAAAISPLQEGVTPDGASVSYVDVQATVEQFGDYIGITDVIQDTHEDPILSEFRTIMGDQIKLTRETLNFNVLKGGTSVFYTNGSSRAEVNTVLDKGDLKRITRSLRGADASYFTEVLSGSPKIGTTPVGAAFYAFAHTDLQADIENISGYVDVSKYPNPQQAMEYEVGAASNVRFVLTTVFSAFADAGAAGSTMIATTNAAAHVDVYPVIIVAPDAWGVVPLRGKDSGSIAVVNPKPSAGDPLGQRGSLGWKNWWAAVILNDSLMARLESSATASPT